MTVDLPESRVRLIWQACSGREDLETVEDGPVKVLYPGRTNDSGGADFRDAVIQTSHGLLTGDIEIHTKSSQWRAHRHHLDPIYNRVVLHVVFRHDIAKPVILQNGNAVPTLALHNVYTPGEGPGFGAVLPIGNCCSVGVTDTRVLSGILDNAGEQRFQARAAGFQTAASPEEAGQALYRGIMTAIGYSQNKHPMAELAGRMPLRRLESMMTAGTLDEEYLAKIEAVLAGTAGLLPSQRGVQRQDTKDVWADTLEKIWKGTGEAVTMSESDWRFFRVRPGNFPARRIAAMCRLLLRYRKQGLLRGLISRLDETAFDGNYRELEDALVVEGGDNQVAAALLGKNRAADIVINVLLPFAAAWGRLNSNPELAEKAAAIYRRYPAAAKNTVERHMCRQLGVSEKLANTARRQQGLLHIFKTFCSLGICRDCPVIDWNCQ